MAKKLKGGETIQMDIGNMALKLTPLKIKHKSTEQILKDAARAKAGHRKINYTRTAAALRARTMKPCKK